MSFCGETDATKQLYQTWRLPKFGTDIQLDRMKDFGEVSAYYRCSDTSDIHNVGSGKVKTNSRTSRVGVK